jgi:hypothetical protein
VGGQLLTRVVPWAVAMTDTAVGPAAADIPNLVDHMAWDAHGAEVKRVVREHQAASRQCKVDNDTPSLDSDVQLLIQNMVRHRVKHNWPFVRAFECRTSSDAIASLPLKVGEWVVFSSADRDETLLVGKVLKLGVAEHYQLQSEYWAHARMLEVSVFTRVPGKAHFVRWSPVASSTRNVRPCALLAVGFSMEPVGGLPLSWPLGLRRPSGQRRLGPAYVMDGRVQAQLSPLGPLTEMVPGPVLE